MRLVETRAAISDRAIPLFKPAPYKVTWGGRGGGKSWDIARALLILGQQRKLFILCSRDIQNSTDESVHKLLCDQIEAMGLGWFYKYDTTSITGVNGTRFFYKGLRNNINSLKSIEAIDIVWVEEADPILASAWEVLLPTIRRDAPFGPFGQGSEIWISFNPTLASTGTYKYWMGKDAPPGTVRVFYTYKENPWFPKILQNQMEHMKKTDYDAYLNVWEGKTRVTLSGAIYQKELTAALKNDRISPFIKHDPSRPVTWVHDLGRADMWSMWAIQQVGTMHNCVDFYENCGFDATHYIREIQDRGYIVSGIWLPHDARQRHASAKFSIEKQFKAVWKTQGIVKVMPKVNAIATRISHTRAMFPRLQFNSITCESGLNSAQHYQYKVDDKDPRNRSKDPLHNWASHACDSLGGYCTYVREGDKRDDDDKPEINQFGDAEFGQGHAQGWMG